MTAIRRRAMLGYMLAGAAGVATGLAATVDPAESAPLMVGTGSGVRAGTPIEPAARRRVCWWRRGRRVCVWR
jgi:hypothetical protein